MNALIEARGMTMRLGGKTVLRNVDFQISAGEIVTIVGPNGSGKSNLLRVIVGAKTASSGTVTHRPGLRIGYVPQRLHIDPTLPLTVRRFLDLPSRVTDAAARHALVEAGAGDLSGRQMAALSGGQFQRVRLNSPVW